MPTYTYRCPEGHEWDEVRRIEESETSEGGCPTCPRAEGSVQVTGTKVPARFSPAFRGSGWTPKFYPDRQGK